VKNSKGGTGLVREERLQVMLSPSELKALDDFRFEHRMPSRAAAVRELLRQGLGVGRDVEDNAGITSSEFGVLKKPKRSGVRS
jgi:metal-responsive CopG/Arc/MetJ family transcriptional regulator